MYTRGVCTAKRPPALTPQNAAPQVKARRRLSPPALPCPHPSLATAQNPPRASREYTFQGPVPDPPSQESRAGAAAQDAVLFQDFPGDSEPALGGHSVLYTTQASVTLRGEEKGQVWLNP